MLNTVSLWNKLGYWNPPYIQYNSHHNNLISENKKALLFPLSMPGAVDVKVVMTMTGSSMTMTTVPVENHYNPKLQRRHQQAGSKKHSGKPGFSSMMVMRMRWGWGWCVVCVCAGATFRLLLFGSLGYFGQPNPTLTVRTYVFSFYWLFKWLGHRHPTLLLTWLGVWFHHA